MDFIQIISFLVLGTFTGFAAGLLGIGGGMLMVPFITMLFAVPILGEKLDALTIGFALAVICTVFLSKKMAVYPVGK